MRSLIFEMAQVLLLLFPMSVTVFCGKAAMISKERHITSQFSGWYRTADFSRHAALRITVFEKKLIAKIL
ncbi:hypothetical protein QUF80_03630 [Desulfococcaceae bacterium HSG8]|nr:hypothetical protein [Desulfococcaceae bacterium HSG8]